MATAAYQIEGGWNVDGRGVSIWDNYTHTYPNRVVDHTNGDVAANSYVLYKDDVAALKRLKVNHYRFSISWTRILPSGDISSRNQAGIDYYHRLIDRLIANNIKPMITMFHWDLPQSLQDLGGWSNPLIIDYFVQYADFLFSEYGKKVKHWITVNEPSEYCIQGYGLATVPPLINKSGVADYLCAHHTILSHAKIYRMYRKKYYAKQRGKIGITLQAVFFYPKDPKNSEHVAAADRAIQFYHGLFANAIFSSAGDYPAVIRERVDQNSLTEGRGWSRLPTFTEQQLVEVRGASDFFGLNYYTSRYVQPIDPAVFDNPSAYRDCAVYPTVDDSWVRAKSNWLYSVPDGLHQLLNWIRINYNGVETIITENGWSDDGQLIDDGRITYIRDHLQAVLDARNDGCNVTGYTVWTLMDNFEWNAGFSERFGLNSIDPVKPDYTRVEKNSATYYRNVIKSRKIN